MKHGAILAAGLSIPAALSGRRRLDRAEAAAGEAGLHEAMFYSNVDEGTVRCELCPQGCLLENGRRGFCRVRECRDGKLYSLVYGLVCAEHVDPIEKKPLYHMLPSSRSYSIATAGCNSRCKFCQNWQISQVGPEETINKKLAPAEAVENAIRSGSKTIAYTYTDPNVFYEYGLDTARLARQRGIRNVWVTGGLINPEPLRELSKYVEAAHIDFKAFDDGYLKEICAQNLKTVTDTIRIAKEQGMWIEIINLIVPTLNDDLGKIREMAVWIRDNVGKDVPLHFSRFYPMYKLQNLPPTPVATLESARKTALDAGLEYVYIGNIPDHEGNNTYCPQCKKLIIERKGYLVTRLDMSGPRCRHCGHAIPGIWQ
jgi:pyruvate formate lyase activating enzyme